MMPIFTTIQIIDSLGPSKVIEINYRRFYCGYNCLAKSTFDWMAWNTQIKKNQQNMFFMVEFK